MKEQVPKLHRQKMLHFTLHNYYFKQGLKLFFKTEKTKKMLITLNITKTRKRKRYFKKIISKL